MMPVFRRVKYGQVGCPCKDHPKYNWDPFTLCKRWDLELGFQTPNPTSPWKDVCKRLRSSGPKKIISNLKWNRGTPLLPPLRYNIGDSLSFITGNLDTQMLTIMLTACKTPRPSQNPIEPPKSDNNWAAVGFNRSVVVTCGYFQIFLSFSPVIAF